MIAILGFIIIVLGYISFINKGFRTIPRNNNHYKKIMRA